MAASASLHASIQAASHLTHRFRLILPRSTKPPLCSRFFGERWPTVAPAGSRHSATSAASPASASADRTVASNRSVVTVLGQEYPEDKLTNISPAIFEKLRRRGLHNDPGHPLGLLKRRAALHFSRTHTNAVGNPAFAIFDNLSPVVRLEQNFDSLLVPADHASRSPKDSYYVNGDWMLRSHMTAHDADLIRSGLDRFLAVGDVYRRDEIDRTHYPVFHQMDGTRLFTSHELFKAVQGDASGLALFDHDSTSAGHSAAVAGDGSSSRGRRTHEKQAVHSYDAVRLVEHDLKRTLTGLVCAMLGKDVESRWVSTYFPFTHPSWELEIKTGPADEWMELLGCGILEHEILQRCGAGNKVGWAFGLGLERLAMLVFSIPDVRLFWSEDSGFLSQFNVEDPFTPVTYKAVSRFPPLYQDISFWIPDGYSSNDFFDIARSIGGDLVEQVKLVDQFTHPKTARTSHCYRVTYRHMERSLTNDEVSTIQERLRLACAKQLGAEVRV